MLTLKEGPFRHLLALAAMAIVALFAAPSAQATIAGIPEDAGADNGTGGDITCTLQTGVNAGERWCSGTLFTSFDGAPIDVNVGFPPAPGAGADGDFPIIGAFHGWGGSKLGLGSAELQQALNNGYAVFSMTDRGWGNSCGATDPNRLLPVCANGYIHLMDTRFEVRDAQEMFEALADRGATGAVSGEGLIDPQKIGVTGGSYGGGLSMALAALKDRKMVQAGDGTLIPWISDGGKAMQIAAAQPDIPWTDLAYSLQPNGHTLDYVADAPYLKRGRFGVAKQSFVGLLYFVGNISGNYAPPGQDPDADLTTWFTEINAGEPYDQDPLSADIIDEITTHHSSHYIDDSHAPAPLLISNGWTDDLFPPDEAIRFYNRTRTNHPGTPISLIFTDHGHMRGQNKTVDTTFRSNQRLEWFDFYLRNSGSQPFLGVQTLTQTCPSSAPSQGPNGDFTNPADQPFEASSWAALAPGEIHLESAAAQTVLPAAGDPSRGEAYDPGNLTTNACATAPGSDQVGAASYRLTAPAGGFTLMGSPTIVADINSPGPTTQVAARLLDITPGSGEPATLVARGIYRPEINPGTDPTKQVFQLHPNGWRFEPGHIVKLELLPNDAAYGRVSNGQLPYTVSNLELRLPVVESPGPLDTLTVHPPAPKVVPAGYQLAADFLSGGGDSDGDGVPNATDDCPNSPGPGTSNGCPTIGADSDHDGVPDSQDQCPNQVGPGSNGGCPQSAGGGQTPPANTHSGSAPPQTRTKKCKSAKRRHGAKSAKKRCKSKRKARGRS